jgi:hypothetical protein
MIASMNVNPADQSCGSPVHIRVPVKSSAVASLEYLPFNQKNGVGLVMVGTVDGAFESWKICAYEADEDEEIVHADEEDATVKLKFDKYFSKPIFHTTLSVISCSAEEKKVFYVLLGSICGMQSILLHSLHLVLGLGGLSGSDARQGYFALLLPPGDKRRRMTSATHMPAGRLPCLP